MCPIYLINEYIMIKLLYVSKCSKLQQDISQNGDLHSKILTQRKNLTAAKQMSFMKRLHLAFHEIMTTSMQQTVNNNLRHG